MKKALAFVQGLCYIEVIETKEVYHETVLVDFL